jgi:hypothetical protein
MLDIKKINDRKRRNSCTTSLTFTLTAGLTTTTTKPKATLTPSSNLTFKPTTLRFLFLKEKVALYKKNFCFVCKQPSHQARYCSKNKKS